MRSFEQRMEEYRQVPDKQEEIIDAYGEEPDLEVIRVEPIDQKIEGGPELAVGK